MPYALMLAGMLLAVFTGSAAHPATAEHLVVAVGTEGSPHQPFGATLAPVMAAAAEEINARGGVLGQSIRVMGLTEDCTTGRASMVADEVVRLSPALVVGHLCTGAATTAAKVYSAAGILFLAPGIRHPTLNAQPANPLVLRLAGRDDRFASETAGFIATRFAGASVALVSDRTRQAKGLASALGQALQLRKIEIAVRAEIESGERTYAPLAERIRASGAGVVVMPAQPTELGVLIEGLRDAGVEAPVVGSEILAVPATEPLARREGWRLILMLPWTGLVRGPAGAADFDRHAFAARAKAGLEVWAAGAMAAGSWDATTVAAALRGQVAATAVGPLRFDEAGDAMVPAFEPHIWLENGWVPLLQSKSDRRLLP